MQWMESKQQCRAIRYTFDCNVIRSSLAFTALASCSMESERRRGANGNEQKLCVGKLGFIFPTILHSVSPETAGTSTSSRQYSEFRFCRNASLLCFFSVLTPSHCSPFSVRVEGMRDVWDHRRHSVMQERRCSSFKQHGNQISIDDNHIFHLQSVLIPSVAASRSCSWTAAQQGIEAQKKYQNFDCRMNLLNR